MPLGMFLVETGKTLRSIIGKGLNLWHLVVYICKNARPFWGCHAYRLAEYSRYIFTTKISNEKLIIYADEIDSCL